MEVKRIRLSKSCSGEAEKQAVMAVLDAEYLGMGTEVQKFEAALEAFFGRPVICTVNGTAGLQLALQACGVGYGDEVLVPSLTYLASYQAISATGARPVSCDVDSHTLCLDPVDAEKRITPKTKAIMPVYYASAPGLITQCYELAARHNLRIVEDAAHALGSYVGDKMVGTFGDVSCFSFDGIKNITAGEGGCVVSDNPETLQLIRDARMLGIHKDTEARYRGERSWEFDVSNQGWRYHMSNIMAAIGLAQLDRFDEFSSRRKSLGARYNAHFAKSNVVQPLVADFSGVVPHIYVVRIVGLLDRDGLRARMLENGIETGVHYLPNHNLSFYSGEGTEELAVTDREFPLMLTLPLHPDLTDVDVDKVVSVLLANIDAFCSAQN